MMSRAWTSGSPASIMTENWRVKTRMSFVETPPPPKPGMAKWSSFGFRLTFSGSTPICRRRARTASASCASISPARTSPCLVLPDHFQTGLRAASEADFVFMFAAAAWAMLGSSLGARGRS